MAMCAPRTMNFSKAYRTIRRPYIGNSFSLPSTTATKARPQFGQLANWLADSNCFRFGNPINYLEVYIHITPWEHRASLSHG